MAITFNTHSTSSTYDVCPICREDPTNPVSPSIREKKITRFHIVDDRSTKSIFESVWKTHNVCQHIFCEQCLRDWMREEGDFHKCPYCQREYTLLFPSNHENVEEVTREENIEEIPEDIAAIEIFNTINKLKEDKKLATAYKLQILYCNYILRFLEKKSSILPFNVYYKFKLHFLLQKYTLLMEPIFRKIICVVVPVCVYMSSKRKDILFDLVPAIGSVVCSAIMIHMLRKILD